MNAPAIAKPLGDCDGVARVTNLDLRRRTNVHLNSY